MFLMLRVVACAGVFLCASYVTASPVRPGDPSLARPERAGLAAVDEPRPAIIAEKKAPVTRWIPLGAQEPYSFHVVADGEAIEIAPQEAVTLAGRSDLGFDYEVANTVSALTMVPLALGSSIVLSLGAVLLAVTAADYIEPTGLSAYRLPMAVGGAVLLTLGTAALSSTPLVTWGVRKWLGPSDQALSELEQVQYVEPGTLENVLAKKVCE